MKIGIIGHGADKFTSRSKLVAIATIRFILHGKLKAIPLTDKIIVVSGHSPVGGIDIWAEEVALEHDFETDLKIPKQYKWDATYGFKQRNIDIAESSDELHVILVDKYPPNFKGFKFTKCYHCNSADHVKSGACWTARQARILDKTVIYHIIKND